MADTSAHLPTTSPGGGETQMDIINKPIADANRQIKLYLVERVPEFRELEEVRDEGSNNPAGDAYFAQEQPQADYYHYKQARIFFRVMGRIGTEIRRVTGVFNIKTPRDGPPRILDMCMAPGAFLDLAMEHNPGAHAHAFTLPLEKGGHKVLIPQHPNITIHFVDINMLGADMGLDAIPQEHPEAQDFLPRSLSPDAAFDIVICDGQALRIHGRAAYRKKTESARLRFTQLAIALQHIKPGGTMLVLLHTIDTWRSILLLRTFCGFSNVRLFKPTSARATRSSCYMVASNIQPRHEDALRAVNTWKMLWKSATFDTEEAFCRLSLSLEPPVEQVLEDFGPTLVRLGRKVWEIQANALGNAPVHP